MTFEGARPGEPQLEILVLDRVAPNGRRIEFLLTRDEARAIRDYLVETLAPTPPSKDERAWRAIHGMRERAKAERIRQAQEALARTEPGA